jgi:hypothetical protein
MKTSLTRKPFALSQRWMIAASCALSLAGPAFADTPEPQDGSAKAADLVLTLPDQWQQADISGLSGIRKAKQPRNNLNQDTGADHEKLQRVDLGCSVGMYDATITTAPFTNRVEGDCKLNYHY